MWRKILTVLSVALIAPALGGCFLSNSEALDTGLPKRIPRECQRLLAKVPDPGAAEGDEWENIARRYRGAWLKGNHRIGLARACEDRLADAIERGAK